MRRIEVRSDDEVTRTVLIRLQNDKTISITLEERDGCELVLVLRGYYCLSTGQNLPVDQEETPPMEDLAPPYLSQHKVVPEKWSYTNQNAMKTICYTMPPTYQMLNRKTNGLYNTMGRQSKPPLLAYSFDNNMNSSLSNRNHYSYDLQNVVSMEILGSGVVEARNEEVLRRVREMQQLVENSEKYLTEQENLERLQSLSEWQESSVDVESDNDSNQADDAPGVLKHSDSLLLLNKTHAQQMEPKQQHFANAAIELLRSESNQSESDNDSLYTPHDSPKHKIDESRSNRISFGLRSPDSKNPIYPICDTDIIDLTLLPPPATPDELDCALPTPINLPPSSFADANDDLEKFLASVTVPPPTQKITPAIELTPEEIMAYIIPPPPKTPDNVIEYATVERKGAFSCCAKSTKPEKNDQIQPLPRRSSDEKPPERPPKNFPQEEQRQRSQSLTNPPKLPPRIDSAASQAPPHLFLPPKKPPLPPVPPLEVLRQKKNSIQEGRTAGIGSPHLQRNRNMYNDLEAAYEGVEKLVVPRHCSTAVSTPTSPHLGKKSLLNL